MSMRDFFRGDRDRDRDRDRWREDPRGENRYGRQDDERHAHGRDWGQGRQWGRDQDQDNERESGRYGSYGGGFDNPQFYGQSGRSDWRESDYGRGRDYESQGGQRGWDEQRDWGERNFGDRFRGGEYGGAGYGGGRQGSGEYGSRQWGSRGQYGSEGGGDLFRGREYGGAGGSRSASGRVGYGGSGSTSSQTGGGLMGLFRGKGPRGYQRSDERIREEVCECLTDDPMIDASNLEVTVKNCEVTLSGTVNSREEKRRAADIIEDLSGVKDVHNNLRVAAEQSSGTQQGVQQQATGTQAGQTTPRH